MVESTAFSKSIATSIISTGFVLDKVRRNLKIKGLDLREQTNHEKSIPLTEFKSIMKKLTLSGKEIE